MALREDLINSAVTFLQDPSVSNAPHEKKVAFLQSKNLTPEEVEVALSRVGEAPAGQGQYGYSQVPARGPPPPPQGAYGYGYGGAPGYWPPPPPPEPPRRDWRDYFIMATVMSGLSYGVYFVAKRYIVPLIAPPTPPQLEQDKASIDASFERAFGLIDQLTTDTAAIKASEESRKERLDTALAEVEAVIQELKTASRRRDDDQRRIGDEVRGLQNMIPKAIKSQEEATDARLKELNNELKSLKTLVGNRITAPNAPGTSKQPNGTSNGATNLPGTVTGNTPGSAQATFQTTSSSQNGSAANSGAGTPTGETENKAQPSQSYSKYTAGKGGIPAWQLAAAKKSEQEKAENALVSPTSPEPSAS